MRFKQLSLAAYSFLSMIAFNNAHATLTSYTGVDGVGLVYSSIADVTWTQDANLFGTLTADNPNLINTIISNIGSIYSPVNNTNHTLTSVDFGSTVGGNGYLTWFGAQAFIQYLNNINYGGSNQWMLPSAGSNPQSGYNINNTAFEKLFYNELGGARSYNIPNTDTFTNERTYAYWLDTEDTSNTDYAWLFFTNRGYQGNYLNNFKGFAWAISPGQISTVVPVPLPSAAWFMGSGLLGLAGMKRRRLRQTR
ncbi:hypothetical protein BJL95_04495 [Methylomonas sp. LWB]|uniref:VPLPA-CTERM sorting domain-containing protein n=1 Tax=Methylomonas sp. LWB TaxID=1905845 RepID=UPI0008D90022|nr:VPLPA-CTERM sorting domain-containing protein [Methylomonas sp. LWB]OHX37837.1 hypothetical protein BJL95_04495 [Methylomonas sp. LWB]